MCLERNEVDVSDGALVGFLGNQSLSLTILIK